MDRNPSGSCGTTVTFTEYAFAVPGIAHEPLGSGKLRVLPPAITGSPNAPVWPDSPRVSTTRQGVMGMKPKPVPGRLGLPAPCVTVNVTPPIVRMPVRTTGLKFGSAIHAIVAQPGPAAVET